MVKNLSTVEGSTKIRLGKNCTDEQAENTIVFNASDTQIDAATPSAIYMTPIRTYNNSTSYIMLYDTTTKEITSSGVRTNAIAGSTPSLEQVTAVGNTTTSNVGIANNNPQHILSVSNTVFMGNTGVYHLQVNGNSYTDYMNIGTSLTTVENVVVGNTLSANTLKVNDLSVGYVPVVTDGNVLTDSTIQVPSVGTLRMDADVSIYGNLVTYGNVTQISANNLTVDDPLILVGNHNPLDTNDLGIIMRRPTANVAIGFRGDENEFMIGYTHSDASGINLVPLTTTDIDVKVYGKLSANILSGDGSLITGVSSGPIRTDLTSNALRITNLETSNGLIRTDLTSNTLRITNLETSNGRIRTDLTSNALRITNLETSSGLIRTDLTSNTLRITNLETSSGLIRTDLTSNTLRITNLETSNGLIRTDLTSNALRITNLETSNGLIRTDLTSNTLRITNLETSNGLIRTDLTSNTLRITNLETSDGLIRTDLTSNALRITNLETSDGLIRTDLTSNALRITNLETDKAPLLDPVFTNNVTVSGNLTVLGTTTTLDTVNLVVKDPIVALSNAAGTVDSGVLINRPGGTNNVFSGYDHSASEYVMGLTDSSAYDSYIVMKENHNFVANIYGNVKASYFIGDGSLLTGVSGGGGGGSGNLTVTGGLTITDMDVPTSVSGSVITLNGGNRTFGVSPLLEVSSNVEHLVYTNLIHGSDIKVLMNAASEFIFSNNISNVHRYTYGSPTTISVGNHAIATFSNLHGSIYADLKIGYAIAATPPVTAVSSISFLGWTGAGDRYTLQSSANQVFVYYYANASGPLFGDGRHSMKYTVSTGEWTDNSGLAYPTPSDISYVSTSGGREVHASVNTSLPGIRFNFTDPYF